MTTKTSPTLMERLQNGEDPLVWDEFFGRYWRLVFTLAKYRGCSDNTSEEIVQEVMLAVFEKQEVFRYDADKGRFRNWLATIVRNQVSKKRIRASERIRGRGGASDDNLAEAEAEDTQPDSRLEVAFENSLLLALLDIVRGEVSPSAYQAFELLALHGRSGAEVAKLTGLSRNAAYLARSKVARRLRELGAQYRQDGQLADRLKQALEHRPSGKVEREVTEMTENTFRSRWESGR